MPGISTHSAADAPVATISQVTWLAVMGVRSRRRVR